MILSIDPSLKSTGWCLYDPIDKEIVEFGNIAPIYKGESTKDKTIVACKLLARLIDTFSWGITKLAIEVPRDRGGSSVTSANNLTPLWAIAGTAMGCLPNAETFLFFPEDWKGRAKKALMNNRVLSKLKEKDRNNVMRRYKHTKKSLTERRAREMKGSSIDDPIGDVLDAIGIALFTSA